MTDTRRVYRDYLQGNATLAELSQSARETLQRQGLMPADAPSTETGQPVEQAPVGDRPGATAEPGSAPEAR